MKFVKMCSLLMSAGVLLSPATEAEEWTFPRSDNGRVELSVPDWGEEGFTLEVWCKPEITDGGYAVLMRGSFGYPKFFGEKDFDCYFVRGDNKADGGRIYTALELDKYHYYVLSCDKNGATAYRDGKAMRSFKGNAVPDYKVNTPLYVGNSAGWGKNFQGAVAVVRIHNRALSAEEIRNSYQALLDNKPLPESAGLIFNEDRRDLESAAAEEDARTAVAEMAGQSGMMLPGVKKAVLPDTAWVFPMKGSEVRFNNVPDWGKKGFTLEVWCKPETADCGYAVLMRGSFGYPKFFGEKDFDCYLVTENNKNAAGRVYTSFETGKYHYFVLTGDPEQSIAYYDGKVMRTNPGNGIPLYIPNVPIHVGNSIGWAKNFDGRVGMVRVHNRALTLAEIKSNYALLQADLPLQCNDSVIAGEDRRMYGNYFVFGAGDTSVVPAVEALGSINFSVHPESLSDCTLMQWNGVEVKATADGSLVLKYGKKSFNVSKVLKVGNTTDITFAWNKAFNYAGFFVDGKFVGNLLKEELPAGKADLKFGGNFCGMIGLVSAAENTLLEDNIGQMITVALDNRNVDTLSYPLSRHMRNKTEEYPTLVDFEDLSGWTITYPSEAVVPVITRSQEEPLWGEYVLRTEFRQGKYPQPGSKVVLTPPQPIKITEDFDAVAMWRHATRYSRPYPALSYSIQYRDSSGKLHDSGDMGGMLEVGWGLHMRPVKELIKAPAELVSITFTGFNEPRRVTYFDSLHFYKRSQAELPDARVLSWEELGVPTRPETILPTAVEPGKVALIQDGQSWKFESVTPSGKKLIFTITPSSGTLSDITATYNNKTFKVMDGGGFYWTLSNKYPVHPNTLIAPNSPRIKGQLTDIKANGNQLELAWQYTVDNSVTYRATWALKVIDNTLIADLRSLDPMVGEFKFGAVTGISGKVVEVPYLTWGTWIHASDPPGIFAAEDFYVSCYIDWYNTDASGLFGESSSTPGGYWKFNASTSDHRWFPDASTRDKTNDIRDVSIINGGSYYWPKTDGVRNNAYERIMVTVNETLLSVLPNIPNPTHGYLQETVNDVWCTRQWYVSKLPMMDYFDQELAMWRELKAYGVDEVNARLHGNINRMYSPRFDGSPATFVYSFTEPQIGGDEKLAWFFDEMKKMGFRIGIYTDHMLLSCMSDGWDRDRLNLDSNGCWLYSADNDKQTKITRMVDLQKKFNAYYREKFGPNCAYLDQITCPPFWRYTDYDARTPGAGKCSTVFRVFVESLRAEEADFGPVLSEGKTQIFFAGLCDSYAQPQRLNMNLLPDFNLRKLHLLSNDCGYHLSEVGLFGNRSTSAEQAYRLLSYEYAYGNTGHLSGIYIEPHMPVPVSVLRSYFLIQPAQKYFALVPIKEVLYNVNGKLGSVDDAIRAGTLGTNQVKLIYENGLEVAVNMNPNAVFEVTLHGKKYRLPNHGFAAYLPGKVEVYSALNNAGERSSLMREGNLLFVVNPQDTEEITAKNDYIIRAKDNALELTPTPFVAAETVTVKTPFSGVAKVTMLDREGNSLSSNDVAVDNNRITINVDGKAFRYLIEAK